MKEVNLYERVVCILASLAVAFIICFSCTQPVYAAEAVPYDQIASMIRTYEQRAKADMDALQEALQNDIDNGNINATSALGRQYLNAVAVQQLSIYNPSLNALYDAVNYSANEAQEWIDWYNSHQTLSVSGSGTSGFYRSYKDQKIHIVNYVSPSRFSKTPVFTIPVFTSDEFTVTFTALSPNWNWTISPYYYANDSRYGINIEVPMYQGMYARPQFTFSEPSGYFYTYTMNSSNLSYNEAKFLNIGGNSIPTLSANLISSNMPYNSNTYIGGLGSYQEIPSATVDTDTPWDYYNNTIIPYIRQNYPDVPDTYYLFPNGYRPASPPDPTEPPTYPNGGIYIGDNYYIGVNILFPTYPGGEPVTEWITDEQGNTLETETVTETEYITDTRPTDAVYNFIMPTLPALETISTEVAFNANLPAQVIALSGGLFSSVYDVLVASKVFEVLPFIIGMAVLVYVIYKIGG